MNRSQSVGRMKKALLVGGLTCSILAPVTGHANNWSISGELLIGIQHPAGGCAAPSCLAMFAGCKAGPAVWDNHKLDASIRAVPAAARNHRASFSWTAEGPPIASDGGRGEVWVLQMREDDAPAESLGVVKLPVEAFCSLFTSAMRHSSSASFELNVDPEADWIVVQAMGARNLRWTMRGIH